MELALSLGDTPKAAAAAAAAAYTFLDKSEKKKKNKKMVNNKDLGFCMALGNKGTTSVEEISNREEDERKGSSDPPPAAVPVVQLDLLPCSPVISRTHHLHQTSSSHLMSFSWLTHHDNNLMVEPEKRGSSEMNRGSIVAVQLEKAVGEDVSGTAALSSSPNSTTSSFHHQMDFSKYGGGGGIRSGNKREFHETTEDIDIDIDIDRDRDRVGAAYYYSSSSRGGGGGIGIISDEEENGIARKKLRLSKEQSAFLEESFKEHNTLNPKQKQALAKQLNLRPRQVEVWFQNRRARTKLKQTEVDCEYLKRCCETLTEENRRLTKELQELRALKSSQPFYMQLPATTLTMCPSCERVATTTTTNGGTGSTPTAAVAVAVEANTTLTLAKPRAVHHHQATS